MPLEAPDGRKGVSSLEGSLRQDSMSRWCYLQLLASVRLLAPARAQGAEAGSPYGARFLHTASGRNRAGRPRPRRILRARRFVSAAASSTKHAAPTAIAWKGAVYVSGAATLRCAIADVTPGRRGEGTLRQLGGCQCFVNSDSCATAGRLPFAVRAAAAAGAATCVAGRW